MTALLLLCLAAAPGPIDDAPAPRWWGPDVEAALGRAGGRRGLWEKTLAATPAAERPGMAYLMADLPQRDLDQLPPEALAENVRLAYRAKSEVPWGAKLPDAVFLDAVLPHGSVTEPRDLMRREFHDRYLPLVKDCSTPGDAALKINAKLFEDYKVKYNTRRIRTDQSSKETIAQGMATCTGLSIMLVEACRSVGVPARLAGISAWPGRGGNHTWAEVWDGSAWRFVGAAEPDPKGLDHAWFVGDAAKAVKDSPRNAVWAVTYKSTGSHFPIVWSRSAKIHAENVTDRYKSGPAPKSPRLMVEVLKDGKRVEADVKALDVATGAPALGGRSLGPSADINQHLSAPAADGSSFLVIARLDGRAAVCGVKVKDDTVVRIDLAKSEAATAVIEGLFADRFGADKAKRERAAKILAEAPFDESMRALAWKAFKDSPIHKELRAEFDAKTVKTADRTSPYLWRNVGTAPKDGRSLVIAMHGGGGTAKRINDGQWKGMFERYYKDHPEAGGYVYLALRAPNDEWNGFYDDAICPLVERLILQFALFGDVNPDKVVILGASHGGYGAFVIGPKTPDRFSAVHASASAPTDGETEGINLRNTRFTYMVGEKDTAYGRADRCKAFEVRRAEWKKTLGGFEGGLEFLPGVGHSVPDRDKVAELVKAPPRDARPKKLVWIPTDETIKHFYWIETPKSKDKSRIEAEVEGNTVKIDADPSLDLFLRLDGRLVDLSKPLKLVRKGFPDRTVADLRPDAETFCALLETLGDPSLAAPVRLRSEGR